MRLPRHISRRDFLNGTLLGLASPLAAAQAGFQGQSLELAAAAHRLRDNPAAYRDAIVEVDDQIEDLVVVGAGISGLTGAYLFNRHAGRPVRILVLEALDQLGGHARRNEFVSRSGKRLVGYGGSQSLDTPSFFSPAARGLLDELGIDLSRFHQYFDKGWAARHGVDREGIYFGREAWGEPRLVVRGEDDGPASWLAQSPMSARAQADLVRLQTSAFHGPMTRLKQKGLRDRLARTTYQAFLTQQWRVDPALLMYYRSATLAYFGVGIDAVSALDAWAAGLPGFDGLDIGDAVDPRNSPSARQLKAGEDEYIYHFPDGNASVARALVRAMRPALLPGEGMETLSSATLDQAALDDPAAAIRLRLQATVVGLRHLGEPSRAELVELKYVDASGCLRAVHARQVLLANWHRVIARLTDELPAAQVHALNDQVKIPLLYGTVLLSNWRAWQKAGVRSFSNPGGFWDEVALDFPVSIGPLKFPESPDEPMLLHLSKVVVPGDGSSARQQAAAGRAQLMGWSFQALESGITELLQGALGAHGFDARSDIEAITVNRWSHGYTYEYMRPWDAYWPAGPLPAWQARRGWGRVAIANSDSGAYAYAHSAIDQATRAVQELLPEAKLPTWSRFPGPDPSKLAL
ncbi:MAG: NAD(P)-binding protein [Proteobacteria bacterium]|uniref:NAD(P)-binding protein n=1 Tax=Roseateles puraquae TaxID=431059 RepID=UPI0031DAFA84|nr:NAD(P)-binding protein [Pseudomonadota bacterium]